MKKIYVFCANDVEEVECLTTVDFCRRADIDTTLVSITGEKEVTGRSGITFKADELIEAIDIYDADGLVLPGGGAYEAFEAHEVLTKALREYDAAGKMVAAICASPSVLGRLGILNGRNATVYPDMEVPGMDINWTEQGLEVSDHVITAQGPGKSLTFALTIIYYLCGLEVAEAVSAETMM